VELTERFADAVGRRPFPLDEACTLIGAHGDRSCEVDMTLRRLDELAASVPSPALESLLATLFGEFGFAGDEATYYDPRNSYLHAVIQRRCGIPVTLSVVLIEVGRRLGVVVEGVGTPAHFVTRAPGEPDVYVDAFAGGLTMDRSALEVRFSSIAPGVDLEPHLEPLPGPDIVRRVLGNLVAIHRRTGDRDGLLWSSQLRTLVPGSSTEDRRAFGDALAASGDFVRAAKILESLVDEGHAPEPDRELAAARRLRARLN
jgi:regulator of sirC expression with transglutaminase-like and TPR domain